MRRGRALAGVLAAVALAAAACSPGGTNEGFVNADIGYEAGDGSFTIYEPDERGDAVEHTGTTYEGEDVSLTQWRGDVVVLNFWYAACPPCRVEAPDLVAIHEDYADEGVHMLGVNPRDDAGAAQAFERTFEIPYPSLHDERASAVAALEGLVPLQAMPTTVVLDREGRVAARILGQFDPSILRGLIDDALAEDTESSSGEA